MSPDVRYLAYRVRARAQRMRRDPRLLEMARELRGAEALELGGPTPLFGASGQVPVYSEIASLDVVNFAATTIWDGLGWDGVTPRRDYIAEARDLGVVGGDRYDAILASHVLEHTANPIRALAQWHRVLRSHGAALVVLPHYAGTFDHRRSVTPIDHLRADAAADTTEDDTTHFAEILARHDRRRDPGGDGPAAFEERMRANVVHRSMHHHVFDVRAAVDLLLAGSFVVEQIAVKLPHHIILLAHRSTPEAARVDEQRLREAIASSPFPVDRRTPSV